MESKTNGIIFNPNLIWLPTPLQMENSEDFAHIDAFLPGSTGGVSRTGNYSVTASAISQQKSAVQFMR